MSIEKETGRPVEILMIEDDPDDAELTTEAIKETKIRFNLNVVDDGIKALAYLRKEGIYADSPRPDFIFLDLYLPKKDGRQVLKEIKADDNLKAIPLVVLTTSRAEQDVLKSYEQHVNCYLTKPVNLDGLLNTAKFVAGWMNAITREQKEEK